KEITPVLHRLQEAFLVYEDQYDGEWDRGWYKFSEMFPNVNLEKYSRVEALEILLQRFAYRQVWFDDKMAKSFYKLPLKDIKTAINSLKEKEIIIEYENGYILEGDADTIKNYSQELSPCTFTLHRNDFLYRSNEHILKTLWKRSGVETLYYILIDGEFRGAAYGKFRNGPPDFSSIEVDLPNNEAIERKQEIIKSTQMLSFGKTPEKYNGENL
ncbi:MAG: hypothetical protein GX896_09745, partial [Clostridiales bacterium]|nr:hypothetical protein [Clostridiales bacterium]